MRTLTLEEAVRALDSGEPVVLPTDTVYGVGVAVGAAETPRVLFEAKGRPSGKPVAWLVEGPEALDVYGTEVSPAARALAEAFWPGALTLVVRASSAVPAAFQSEEGTIGLRMPASRDTLALIRTAGAPLAVTSANLSGEAAPATLGALDERLADATAGVYVPNGSLSHEAIPPASAAAVAPLASTVIDCTADEPRVLREGALPWAVLKGALP